MVERLNFHLENKQHDIFEDHTHIYDKLLIIDEDSRSTHSTSNADINNVNIMKTYVLFLYAINIILFIFTLILIKYLHFELNPNNLVFIFLYK